MRDNAETSTGSGKYKYTPEAQMLLKHQDFCL
jgi:hypothetical protein